MQYTHMFEKILSGRPADLGGRGNKEPLYFGHLHLPGGTSSAKSGEDRYRLRTWREELLDEDRFDSYDESTAHDAADISTPQADRSAVVGCLMEIIDHRRMEDGRLMILVQALERFVVDEILITKPYSVANVQILLDKEELPWERRSLGKKKDANYEYLRGRQVAASFLFHDYEFDRPKLPVKTGNGGDGDYLTNDDVPWIEISQLLPFVHYSMDDTCLDLANEKASQVDGYIDSLSEGNSGSSPCGDELPMEQELRNGGILWDPAPVSGVVGRRSRDALDCDALETLLWLALDDFCRATGFVLPQEVGRLLPPEIDYLGIKADRPLSGDYPKLRRQRRLSYLAPALIENLEIPMRGTRQAWLNTPSTAARLLGALERYDYLNNKIMGQFE